MTHRSYRLLWFRILLFIFHFTIKIYLLFSPTSWLLHFLKEIFLSLFFDPSCVAYLSYNAYLSGASPFYLPELKEPTDQTTSWSDNVEGRGNDKKRWPRFNGMSHVVSLMGLWGSLWSVHSTAIRRHID